MDEKNIHNIVERFDILTPTPVDLKRVGIKSVYDQYKTGAQLHIEDLDLVLEIINDLYIPIITLLQEIIYPGQLFIFAICLL